MSKNFYLDFSVIDSIKDPYKHNSQSIMSLSGKNIGNFAFRHALKYLTSIDGFSPLTYSLCNQALDSGDNPGKVIMSCANWIGANPALEASNEVRAKLIERFDCPVVAFGLGVQAASGAESIELGPNTIRLVKCISERSQKISVRDNLTRDVFAKLGVHNVTVTGCPSNFINPNPNLGAEIYASAEQLVRKPLSWKTLRTHISEFSGGNQSSGTVLNNSLKIMREGAAFYVLQSPVLLPLVLREDDTIPSAYASNAPEGSKTPEQLLSLLKSKVMHFTGMESWMDFARTCDLSIGMRIHGNMVPLQTGVPSVVISHDSRTEGLSSFMGIPSITAKEFESTLADGPQQILRKCMKGIQNYDNRRRELAETWRTFLTDTNMPIGVSVKQIIADQS